MRNTGLALLFVISAHAFAGDERPIVPELRACTPNGQENLEESMRQRIQVGFHDVYSIKNEKNQVVGYFASDTRGSMHAEVCEFLDEGMEITAASVWYYWNSPEFSTSPRTWKARSRVEISQDEGSATFKVLTASADGGISAVFTVRSAGLGDRRKVVRKTRVHFDKRD